MAAGPRRRERTADELIIRWLLQEHGGALVRYAERLMGDRALGEDVVQETLVRAWRDPDALTEGKGSVRGYLFAIARHVAIARHRARRAEVAATDRAAPTVPDHAGAIVDSVVALDRADAVVDSVVALDHADAVVDSVVVLDRADAVVDSMVALDRADAVVDSVVALDHADAVVDSVVVLGHADAVVDSIVVLDALDTLSPEHREVLLQIFYRGRSLEEAAAALGVPAGTVKSRCYYALRRLRAAITGAPARAVTPAAEGTAG